MRKGRVLSAIVLLLLCSVTLVGQNPSWWNDGVFYEVFVRSFQDSDGDGNGDIRGLINRLNYLNDGDPATHNDLGVNALWLMPVQQSPSYHGYDVTDYRTIEEDYGTNEDFKELIDEAHARGIKVIVDYVMNHTSTQHPWFIESQDPNSDKRDWYTWSDSNPGNRGPWNQTVWHHNGGDFFYGLFWSGMPDLNYENGEVKQAMFDHAEFWLDEMNVDGFRLDAIKYIYEDGTVLEDTPETFEFWKEFRTYYKGVDADALCVGEAWTYTDKIVQYVNNGGLDMCFDFDLAESMLKAANEGDTEWFKAQLLHVVWSYESNQYGTFLTNHDINRVMDRLGGSEEKARLAAGLLMTVPGVPFVYYGEEIGMTGSKPDENIRTPLQWDETTNAGFSSGTPWRPVNGGYAQKNIADQQADPGSLWRWYQQLIKLRNHHPALKYGGHSAVTTLANANSSAAFLRTHEDETLLVVANCSPNTESNVTVSSLNTSLTAGDYDLVNLLKGDAVEVSLDNSGDASSVVLGDLGSRSVAIYKFIPRGEAVGSITFQVDVSELIASGQFDEASQSIELLLSENGESATVQGGLVTSGQSGLFEIEVADVAVGSTVTYSYQLAGSNGIVNEFDEGNDRSYLVVEGEQTVRDQFGSQVLSETPELFGVNLNVFPNPSEKSFYISGGELRLLESGFMKNIKGEIVMRLNSAQLRGQSPVAIEGLPSGVYFLEAKGTNVLARKRIMIQPH